MHMCICAWQRRMHIGIVKTRPRAHFSPFLFLYESLAVLIQKGKGNCICRDQSFYPVQAGEWLVTTQNRENYEMCVARESNLEIKNG